MDELKQLVAQNADIPSARVQLYTLLNEPSDDPLDYYFTDEDQYAGYAQPLGDSRLVVWVVAETGYSDLTLRD
jgi:hypothetical protein